MFACVVARASTHLTAGGQDLYADLVAPTLRANLLAETYVALRAHARPHAPSALTAVRLSGRWRRSPYLSSYCQPPYTVENVNTLQLGVGLTRRSARASSCLMPVLVRRSLWCLITHATMPSGAWRRARLYACLAWRWGSCASANRAMSKTAAEGNWVCIGDINRMDSQYIRGAWCLRGLAD